MSGFFANGAKALPGGMGAAFTPPPDPAAVALAAIVAGYSSAPNSTRQGHMQTFISALMTAGIWSLIDILYVFATTEDQGSRVNWKNPGTFNAVKAGTTALPTFVADNGWTSAALSYLATGYTLSTGGGQFVRNDGHMLAGCLTDANGAASTMLCGATSYAGIQPRTSGGALASIGQSSATDTGSANTGKGLYGWDRSNGTSYDRYKNGALVDSPTRSSLALPATEVLVLTHNGSNLAAKQVSLFSMGKSLGSTRQADFNTAYAAFMTAIGTSPT